MVNDISITLIRIHGIPEDSSLEILYSDQKSKISIGETSILSSPISPHAVLFNVIHENSNVASSTVALSRISSLRSRSIWVQCKDLSDTGKKIQIKISVLTSATDQDSSDCPYLELLASGNAENCLANLQRNNQTAEKKSLKVNFEPDAPPRLGVEVKTYEAASLAELDVARLESIGGDQIKKNVRILNEENKKLGINSLGEHREEMKEQVNSRVAQEEECEKFTENTILEITELLAQLGEIEAQRNTLAAEVIEEENHRRENQIEIDVLQGQLGGLNREILKLKAQRVRFRDIENLLDSSRKFYAENLKNKEILESKFDNSLRSADSVRQNSANVVLKLEQDEEYYKQKLSILLATEQPLTDQNKLLKSTISELKIKLSLHSAESVSDSSVSSNERYSKLSLLQELQNISFQHDQESKLKMKSALQQKEASHSSLINLYRALEAQCSSNLDKQLDVYLNSNELIYLEQTCCIQGDISNLTESLSKLPKFHNNANKSALKYLDSTSSYMLRETEGIREQCCKINSIMDSVADKDSECDRVRAVMGEIKERHPPFIPKLDDPVDVALFEFIKSCEMPIPIPFTREESGVYLFGTKRIFLKLENGNIVIRIGGGYTTILNFIEIYTPIELERQEDTIEEACPQLKTTLARFSQSPQKGMSPQRAARILQGSVEVQATGTSFKPASPYRRTPVKK